jgi:hypothetical protein
MRAKGNRRSEIELIPLTMEINWRLSDGNYIMRIDFNTSGIYDER